MSVHTGLEVTVHTFRNFAANSVDDRDGSRVGDVDAFRPCSDYRSIFLVEGRIFEQALAVRDELDAP